MDGGFFTLVLTFFLNIFYPRIVDSEFCCMFTPSQRSDTKKHHDYEKAIHHIRKHWIFSCSTGDVLHWFIRNTIRLQIVVDSFRGRRITKREQSRTTPVIVIQQ